MRPLLGAIAALMLLAPVKVAGQPTFTVKGQVTDDSGEPLPGVFVEVENMKIGTMTDGDGNYTIDAKSGNASLVFSCFGLMTEKVKIDSRHLVNISMIHEVMLLDDVVVIGYGEVKKSDLTGSVSTIKGQEMDDKVILSVEDAMKGKAAGVYISQNDGVPGSEFSIRIRGVSSVNASSTPIFVVDGVICEDTSEIGLGDIESMEIMKDASSTAIYGSRGANGVIIITTKKGREGRAKVTLQSTVGVQAPSNYYDMMDASEYQRNHWYRSWEYQTFANAPTADGGQWLGNPAYDYYRDSAADDANWWRMKRGSNLSKWETYRDSTSTDWQRAMFRQAVVRDYRISVRGGNKSSKYSVMASYFNQEGIIVFSGHEKLTARLNYENQISEKVRLLTNMSFARSENQGLATGSAGTVVSTLRKSPLLKVDDDDDAGDEIDEQGEIISSNLYYQAKHITREKESFSGSLNMGLIFALHKELTLRVNGTYNFGRSANYTYYPSTVSQGYKVGGQGSWGVGWSSKWTNEDLLYWTKTFDRKNILKIMGGFTIEGYTNNSLSMTTQQFEKEELGANNLGQGTMAIIPTTARGASPYQMMSFLSRAEYMLKGRYLFTATMRADGSSRFGASHKWGYFPSGAFAWKIDQEPWMKKARKVEQLKLRLSAGTSGNTSIPAYRSLSTMTTAFVPMSGNEIINYGLKLERPDNPDLKWETTTQYDAGVDFVMKDNKFSMTVDSYAKITDDLLLNRNVPYYTGYRKAWSNIGSVMNYGLEITLGSRLLQKRNFFIDADFNIAFNRSRVLDIPGGIMYFDPGVLSGSGNCVVIKNGEPLGQWFGYEVEGIFKSQAEIDALPNDYKQFSLTKSNLRPGDHRIKDIDGNGQIDSDDRTLIGNGEPKATGGLSLAVGIKNVTITTGFQFSYGSSIFNANLSTLENGGSYNMTNRYGDNCWIPTLYDATGAVAFAGNPDGYYRLPGLTAENYCLSAAIEDGSYIRWGHITVSYNFGWKFLRKLGLSAAKFFVTAKNLHVWTGYYGYDPEVNTKQGGFGDFMPSLDYGSYPYARTVSGGFNITF